MNRDSNQHDGAAPAPGGRFSAAFSLCVWLAMLAGVLALFWFQTINFRKSFVAELESLGAVIAQNSAAPLAFEDKKSAVELLSALKVRPHITSAGLYDAHGKLFAHFGPETESAEAEAAPREGVMFDRGYASLCLPVAMQEAAPARLQLRARYQDKHAELLSLYGTVLAQALEITAPVEDTTLRHGRETVLVAEDEDALREMAAQVQARAPGLRVIYSSGYTPGMAGQDVSLLEGRNFLPKPYSIVKLAQFVRECLDAPLRRN